MITDDLAVYLVTAEPAGDQTVQVVAAAVAGGVRVVQLRDKAMTTRQRIAALHRLQDAVPEAIVIVNDDLAAAAAVPGVGVHVGPDDDHPARVRDLLGPDAVIGWSIHDRDQLDDRDGLGACDYVAASPVWPTPTKIDTGTPWGLDGVAELRSGLPQGLPLIGIGGIGAGNAGRVIDAGADGVAVVSAICAAPDPRAAAAHLVAVVRQARSRS
ncbi:thiamine phosphate synthase [Microlunatus sp. Gsoil 973]|jgi:thiamine-phosphate pyrophosphorylase|uniref:thiamine phosphate synthase n=1 Tax=Microlunatus sp. Gsoil 973 TaxID=2672569 RepID=UPI0012B4F9BB|nr:thiamine phosphate synthase [Microlunatus sp. Gsoil 973]QGN32058.1 thiamine phosphate synthase [Microlunatus sp. Gsoil 973]